MLFSSTRAYFFSLVCRSHTRSSISLLILSEIIKFLQNTWYFWHGLEDRRVFFTILSEVQDYHHKLGKKPVSTIPRALSVKQVCTLINDYRVIHILFI